MREGEECKGKVNGTRQGKGSPETPRKIAQKIENLMLYLFVETFRYFILKNFDHLNMVDLAQNNY